MVGAAELIERLFHLPGDAGDDADRLLSQAASAHARLLLSAAESWKSECPLPLRVLRDFLLGPAERREKRALLEQPGLIEALHTLGRRCPDIASWDDGLAGEAELNQPALLGNIALGLLLRDQPHWNGIMSLATDEYGRIHFSGSPVYLSLWNRSTNEPLANQEVSLRLSCDTADWGLADGPRSSLFRTNRDFVRQVSGTASSKCHGVVDMESLTEIGVSLGGNRELTGSGIEYESIPNGSADRGNAALTGDIVLTILEAMRENSPAIYHEFRRFIRVIRGFNLPTAWTGTLASFSCPTCPGRMGFNISFTDDGQPRLSPFCFTWLGHELGHTRHYLIHDVEFLHGWRILTAPNTRTEPIPRYERPLPLRTLFQIPYVHLYEWVLHLDFLEHGYAGLPWRVEEDPLAAMAEIEAEIHEALELLNHRPEVTPLGHAVLAHMRCLTSFVEKRARRAAASA